MSLDADAEKSRQRVLTCVASESLRMQHPRQQLFLATLIVDLHARLEWLLKESGNPGIPESGNAATEALSAQRTLLDKAAQEAVAANSVSLPPLIPDGATSQIGGA